MSLKCTRAVWERSRVGGSMRLLLLALADKASDEGVCFPSVATLRTMTMMSERNIRYLIAKLVHSGELRVERGKGRGGSNRYHLQCLHLQSLQEGCNSLQGGGATGCRKKVQPVAPELSGTVNELARSPAPLGVEHGGAAGAQGEGTPLPMDKARERLAGLRAAFGRKKPHRANGATVGELQESGR